MWSERLHSMAGAPSMASPLRKRGSTFIRELRPPAQAPQGETRIYASRVKSAMLVLAGAGLVAVIVWTMAQPSQSESPNDQLGRAIAPIAVVLFSLGALSSLYYVVTPIPLFRLNAESIYFQRLLRKPIEIAWRDIESISPSKVSGIYPYVMSTFEIAIGMKASVALTYPYGRRPTMRVPTILLDRSPSDVVDAIAPYKQVVLISGRWYRH
jgi:hypothetical protein